MTLNNTSPTHSPASNEASNYQSATITTPITTPSAIQYFSQQLTDFVLGGPFSPIQQQQQQQQQQAAVQRLSPTVMHDPLTPSSAISQYAAPFSARFTKFASPPTSTTSAALFEDAFAFFNDMNDAIHYDNIEAFTTASTSDDNTTPTPTIISAASPIPQHFYRRNTLCPAPLSPSSVVSVSSADTESPSLGPMSYEPEYPSMVLPYIQRPRSLPMQSPLYQSPGSMDNKMDAFNLNAYHNTQHDIANVADMSNQQMMQAYPTSLQTPIENAFPRSFRLTLFDNEMHSMTGSASANNLLAGVSVAAMPAITLPMSVPVTPSSSAAPVSTGQTLRVPTRARSNSVSTPTVSPPLAPHKRRANAGTRPRPYSCHMCASSFTRRSHLNRHCNTVHNRLTTHNRQRSRTSPSSRQSSYSGTPPSDERQTLIDYSDITIARAQVHQQQINNDVHNFQPQIFAPSIQSNYDL